MYEIKVSCDGAHWGLSDIYPQYAEQIKERLEKGLPFHMTYGSKKEICWCKLHYNGKFMQVTVCVSDDFDAEFSHEGFYEVTTTGDKYAEMQDMIGTCWDKADNDAKLNHPVTMYCVGAVGHMDGKPHRANWLITYIKPTNPEDADYPPPGDNYQHWGWDLESNTDDTMCFYHNVEEIPYGITRDQLGEIQCAIELGSTSYTTKDGKFMMTKEM